MNLLAENALMKALLQEWTAALQSIAAKSHPMCGDLHLSDVGEHFEDLRKRTVLCLMGDPCA